MLIGAHLSVAGGYRATVEYALEVGAECMQVFAKSPRQWNAKPLDPDAAAQFVSARAEAGLGPLFTHTAYLINLSTDDPELSERSSLALADELVRGALLGAAGVVTHVGNDPLDDARAAAARAGAAIERAFELAGPAARQTRLLLENTAGAGRSFGSDFTQLGWLLGELSAQTCAHVGVCLDTCHAHAFGTDLSDGPAWERLLDHIDQTCGPGSLGAVHANDCKFARGERKDRHEWIGRGFLGDEAFREMLCAARLADVPAITEMPGDVPEKELVNLGKLKELRDTCR